MKWKFKRCALIAVALGTFPAGACGVSKPESGSEEPAPGWETISRDLALGSRGSDVAALHEFLTNFGYFPNADLQRRFPAWRPIVPMAPAAADVFDERTAQAVLTLQSKRGLPRTGVVDEATRAVLSEGQCGVPDGIVAPDPSDKFAAAASSWHQRVILYSVPTTFGVTGLDAASVSAAIANAFQAWRNEVCDIPGAGLLFSSTTGAADIDIRFGTPTSTAVADTTAPPASGSITHEVITLRDQANYWSFNGPVIHHYDLQSVLMHEIGHALGLEHSSISKTVDPVHYATMSIPMDTGSTARQTPEVDDHVSILTKYALYVSTGTVFSDLGGGADGSIWAVSGGGLVYQFGGVPASPTWTRTATPPDPAVRIAVGPGGVPWITTTTGEVLSLTTNSASTGSWMHVVFAAAKDIGVGYNGDVWIVSTANQVWKYSGGLLLHEHTLHSALKITVGPTGIPYILDTANLFWRYSNTDPFSGTWQSIAGQSSDLAIGPGNYLWSIGGPVGANLVSLGVRDDQVATGDGSLGGFGTPAENQWWPPGGLRPGQWDVNTNVAVDSKGNPWFITLGGAIMTTVK